VSSNVASHYAGDLDLGDLEFKRRRFDNRAAYRQSKQANRMLTVVQAEELAEAGIVVNACHPGNPSSVLSRSLGFGGVASPDESARTPVMLALGELGADVTGQFFAYGSEVACEFAKDRDAIYRLQEICRQYD
jgi:NAD(P)-dependent dehydrogenase (short-subunit alcohol dehydrogenase family)